MNLEGVQPYVLDYARLAAELDIWLVTGVLERVPGEERTEYYNVGLVFDNRGRMRARYRKINLWRFTEGQLDAGDEPTTFDTPFGRFGMLICSDALYPSLLERPRRGAIGLSDHAEPLVALAVLRVDRHGPDRKQLRSHGALVEPSRACSAPGGARVHSSGHPQRRTDPLIRCSRATRPGIVITATGVKRAR